MTPAHWIKAERDFVLARVRGHDDYRWVGSSSTAMVVSAIAPPHLHAAMDAILADWVPLVDRTDHHHGVAAARAMAEKETPVIQAILEAGSAPSTHGRQG